MTASFILRLITSLVMVVGGSYGIVRLLRRFDRRADRDIRAHIDQAIALTRDDACDCAADQAERDAEILDRLEAELDHRAIRKIEDEHGHRRWTR